MDSSTRSEKSSAMPSPTSSFAFLLRKQTSRFFCLFFFVFYFSDSRPPKHQQNKLAMNHICLLCARARFCACACAEDFIQLTERKEENFPPLPFAFLTFSASVCSPSTRKTNTKFHLDIICYFSLLFPLDFVIRLVGGVFPR